MSEALVITCVQYIPSAGSVLLAVIQVQFFQGIKLQRKGWACRSFPSRPGHDGLAWKIGAIHQDVYFVVEEIIFWELTPWCLEGKVIQWYKLLCIFPYPNFGFQNLPPKNPKVKLKVLKDELFSQNRFPMYTVKSHVMVVCWYHSSFY